MNYSKTSKSCLIIKIVIVHMEASGPKWVNTILNIIGVNTLRLGGLHIQNVKFSFFEILYSSIKCKFLELSVNSKLKTGLHTSLIQFLIIIFHFKVSSEKP